ncbi:hypothetical protein MKY37_00525 [Psychrobacillus sp. FSL K6-2836]|uniref:hypothetical protein n=1 Tax=Psychrobacillus sp. FSL K6-2836 TaxID=2921548 RepID=UPI0030F6375D
MAASAQYVLYVVILPLQSTGKVTKHKWDITARKSPNGSGQQDVGHSGFVARRGVICLSSVFQSVGMKKTPPIEVSLFSILLYTIQMEEGFIFNKY